MNSCVYTTQTHTHTPCSEEASAFCSSLPPSVDKRIEKNQPQYLPPTPSTFPPTGGIQVTFAGSCGAWEKGPSSGGGCYVCPNSASQWHPLCLCLLLISKVGPIHILNMSHPQLLGFLPCPWGLIAGPCGEVEKRPFSGATAESSWFYS